VNSDEMIKHLAMKLCSSPDAELREITSRVDGLLLLESCVIRQPASTGDIVKVKPAIESYALLHKMIEVIGEYYDISPEDIKGPRRWRSMVIPRQMGMAISSEITKHSLLEIGDVYNRDHTTVIQAKRSIASWRHRRPEINTDFLSLKERLMPIVECAH